MRIGLGESGARGSSKTRLGGRRLIRTADNNISLLDVARSGMRFVFLESTLWKGAFFGYISAQGVGSLLVTLRELVAIFKEKQFIPTLLP